MMCSGYASPIGKRVRWGLRAGQGREEAAQGNPSFTVGLECLHWASPQSPKLFKCSVISLLL